MPAPVRRLDARSGYDLWAPTYDDTPNPIVAMDRRIVPSRVTAATGERVLDAACGTGAHFGVLLERGCRVVGADFSSGMLRVAATRAPGVPLVQCNLEHPLPFASSSFDFVLCSLVGEHLDDLVGFFRSLRSVLSTAGALVFSVYHPQLAAAGREANFERDGVEFRLGARTHTIDDYRGALEAAGFAAIEWSEHAGGEELLEDVPTAGKYVGAPLLVVFTAKGARGA